MSDNELLADGEPAAAPTVESPPTATSPPPPVVPASASPAKAPWTEREIRTFELVLVCLLAFGRSILSSGHTLWLYGGYIRPAYETGTYGWIYNIFCQASGLGLLCYVLLRRRKSFADLGFNWEKKDIGRSILLRLGGWLAFYAVYNGIYYSGLTTTSYQAGTTQVAHLLFGGGIFEATILYQFLNPFFEELIVRAYVMTEITFLTNSLPKAVMVSTLLQTSYHFYQGAPAAIGHGATFLIWSIYYAKTGRIAPIILAHLYSDVGSTLWYGLHH